MRRVPAFMPSFIFLLTFISLSSIFHAQSYLLSIAGVPEKFPFETVSALNSTGAFCAAVQMAPYIGSFSYFSYNGVVCVDKKQGMDMLYMSADELFMQGAWNLSLASYEQYRRVSF